jgi:hypothetical protein
MTSTVAPTGVDHGHGEPTIEREATVAGVTATLRLSPGRAGLNRLHVHIEDADGNRIELGQEL